MNLEKCMKDEYLKPKLLWNIQSHLPNSVYHQKVCTNHRAVSSPAPHAGEVILVKD